VREAYSVIKIVCAMAINVVKNHPMNAALVTVHIHAWEGPHQNDVIVWSTCQFMFYTFSIILTIIVF